MAGFDFNTGSFSHSIRFEYLKFEEQIGDATRESSLPLANYPHHGEGLSFDAAMTVLRELCASPAFTALVLTEVNPTHDPGGELLGRYVDGVAAALANPAPGR